MLNIRGYAVITKNQEDIYTYGEGPISNFDDFLHRKNKSLNSKITYNFYPVYLDGNKKYKIEKQPCVTLPLGHKGFALIFDGEGSEYSDEIREYVYNYIHFFDHKNEDNNCKSKFPYELREIISDSEGEIRFATDEDYFEEDTEFIKENFVETAKRMNLDHHLNETLQFEFISDIPSRNMTIKYRPDKPASINLNKLGEDFFEHLRWFVFLDPHLNEKMKLTLSSDVKKKNQTWKMGK